MLRDYTLRVGTLDNQTLHGCSLVLTVLNTDVSFALVSSSPWKASDRSIPLEDEAGCIRTVTREGEHLRMDERFNVGV